jgi:hypothetical protein
MLKLKTFASDTSKLLDDYTQTALLLKRRQYGGRQANCCRKLVNPAWEKLSQERDRSEYMIMLKLKGQQGLRQQSETRARQPGKTALYHCQP